MFTVKRVWNGLESYVQADRVERRHGLNDDIAGVHLYVDHGQCDHPMGIIETGTVYVMNESGATVGVHRLGWGDSSTGGPDLPMPAGYPTPPASPDEGQK